MGKGAAGRSASSCSLPAEHTHTGCVYSDEPPGGLLVVCCQRLDKGVGCGAVGVPVLGVNAPATTLNGIGGSALGLEKVLFEDAIVNVHLAQHCHLLAFDVRGCGLIPNPHTDTVTH